MLWYQLTLAFPVAGVERPDQPHGYTEALGQQMFDDYTDANEGPRFKCSCCRGRQKVTEQLYGKKCTPRCRYRLCRQCFSRMLREGGEVLRLTGEMECPQCRETGPMYDYGGRRVVSRPSSDRLRRLASGRGSNG